jgi:protein-disulfide isomerase
MRKSLLLISALLLASVEPFASAQVPHPWLNAQLKKDRYPCPAGTSPFRGPADAPVTIVEFIDYDCPFCRGSEQPIRKVLAAYPTQVKLVFKNLPLDLHSNAKNKAVIAECVGIQGRYWQAHDRFLAGAEQNKAAEGVDKKQLKACVSQGGEGQVAKDVALAKHLGLATTPSYVVDGIRIGGAVAFPQFKLLIDAELARKAASK